MREAKFRAYDLDDKKMWKVVAISKAIWGESEEEKHIKVCNFDKSPTNKETDVRVSKNYKLMEFTGLKDKTDKEIYEGDIVDYLGDIDLTNSNALRVIEYKAEEACFVARLPIGVEGEDAVYLNKYDFLVTGNIYENSNLLEELK